ncbi:MAG: hypothetical protein FWG79_04650 [Bacteroidales bacterium]|nr:hypothetical protein [Bacteroidales bacterium]
MKKLFLPLAVLAMLFGACNKDKNGETNKLLSKITHPRIDGDGNPQNSIQAFEYDGQNRMTKSSWISPSGEREDFVFSYSGNSNAPTKYVFTEYSSTGAVLNSSENLMEYSGNQVFRVLERDGGRDTVSFLTIDANGRVTKNTWGEESSSFSEESFSYNADGNMTKIIYISTYDGEEDYRSETNFTYSTVKSVFRHVNVPDWLIWFHLGWDFSKSGYMVSQIQRVGSSNYDNFVYTTDADGYVLTCTYTYISDSSPDPIEQSTQTFEYINAK